MVRRNSFLSIAFCILTNLSAKSQPTAELQKQLLQQLNSVLITSPQNHWAFEGEKMSIDTPFTISKAGTLSVTLHYTTDTSNHQVRYEAPLSTITRVAQDMYLILKYKEKEVRVYESNQGSDGLTETMQSNLFHIGLVDEASQKTDSIRHILALLLNNKELSPDEYFFRDYEIADSSFSEGLIAVDRNEKYGFINLKREIVVPFTYDNANDFVEGLAAVKKDGKWGYINSSGKLIIPFQYLDINDFEDGKANVRTQKKKWVVIDKTGKIVRN